MKRVSKKEKRINEEVKSLSFSYNFLLIATIIFFTSLSSFTFYVFDMRFSYNVFILPFIFFLVDVILKEVGLNEAIKSVAISTVFYLLFTYFIDAIFGVDTSILKYLGVTFAFLISNIVNLMIYYFMLDNFKTPFFFVLINLVFSCLIYNMFYFLFALRFNFSDTFWTSYFIIAFIQFLLSAICTILLSFVKQGVD